MNDVQRIWWASRAAVLVVSLAAAWMTAGRAAGQVEGLLSRWDSWDVTLFIKIAQFGYDGYPQGDPDEPIVVAFFPGLPLLLRGLHELGLDYRLAGLVVSSVAGAVACSALARLARAEDDDPRLPSRAVLVLVLSPYAVFLAAGYSEALFLALALPAWLAARRGRWPLACVLATAASTVRITGLFLAAALLVEYLVSRRGRPGRELPWLALPLLPVVAFFGYLRHLTGDWRAWQHAQEEFWGRTLTWPWEALRTTWDAAFDPATTAAHAWAYRADIVTVLVGALLVLWLLRRARFGEATYVGLQVVALATSSYYFSVARAALLWWPLWLVVAQAGLRRPALNTAYVAVAAPLMVVGVVAFTSGRWVG